ncbi:hypothetical protein EV356DRAFT_28918 [Viridothelium virens]|uniref:Uncharacterized protein n=1 Tax=Viridothelium virens TaxID=1048519 RepID=A0A6A6HI44_VIRVR|nr:hypothetical protein EV356DRAFT_28918 [Viridothelium virens]
MISFHSGIASIRVFAVMALSYGIHVGTGGKNPPVMTQTTRLLVQLASALYLQKCEIIARLPIPSDDETFMCAFEFGHLEISVLKAGGTRAFGPKGIFTTGKSLVADTDRCLMRCRRVNSARVSSASAIKIKKPL